jgi:hypothetical protein
MSGFGVGDFGYDSAAAVGFGKGSFGHGQFGLDADTIEWISPLLMAGVYKFGVKVTDGAGNQSSASETEPITVMPAARPAEQVYSDRYGALLCGVSKIAVSAVVSDTACERPESL